MVKGLEIFSKFINSNVELDITDEGMTKPKKTNKAIKLCKKRENLSLVSEKTLEIFLNKNFEASIHIIGINITPAANTCTIISTLNFEELRLLKMTRRTEKMTAAKYQTLLSSLIL